jgi:hypothetical protein
MIPDVFCARSLYAFGGAAPHRSKNAQHVALAFALSL